MNNKTVKLFIFIILFLITALGVCSLPIYNNLLEAGVLGRVMVYYPPTSLFSSLNEYLYNNDNVFDDSALIISITKAIIITLVIWMVEIKIINLIFRKMNNKNKQT